MRFGTVAVGYTRPDARNQKHKNQNGEEKKKLKQNNATVLNDQHFFSFFSSTKLFRISHCSHGRAACRHHTGTILTDTLASAMALRSSSSRS
jgi:hypothetical protein